MRHHHRRDLLQHCSTDAQQHIITYYYNTLFLCVCRYSQSRHKVPQGCPGFFTPEHRYPELSKPWNQTLHWYTN